MEKFDVKLYAENEKNKIYEYKEDNKTILLLDLDDVYRKSVYYDNCACEDHISYYKKELTPKVIYRQIYGTYVGKIKHYDIYGNLEKERDADALFSYSLYDLRDWIKGKYKVDIFEKKQGYLVSRSETPIPHYMVKFVTDDGKYIMYSINGKNGEIIFQDINGEEKEVNPVDWAKEAKKNRNKMK